MEADLRRHPAGCAGAVFQFFPDDVSPRYYGFTEDDCGPQRAGEDVVPDLTCEIAVTPDMQLRTEQHEMSTLAVGHYQAGGLQLETLTLSGDGEQRPVIVLYQGKLWVVDGLHRIAASRLRGDPSITGWYVDVDQ